MKTNMWKKLKPESLRNLKGETGGRKIGKSLKSESALSGMKEITAFVGRSKATVLDWVRKYGFPAKKITEKG